MNGYGKGLLRAGRGASGGFTLVEMLLVLVILATLAAIVVPKMAGRGQDAKITAAGTQIENFSSVLDAFEVDNGFYPGGNDGLNALIEQPQGANNWKGPYLRGEIPADPWGNPYVYEYPGKHNDRGFDIYSNGPDGQPGTDDDVANWKTAAKQQ